MAGVSVACGDADTFDPQRLSAVGQVVADDGATPVEGVAVDRYRLGFVVMSPTGEVEIIRSFEQDAHGQPIVTDASGHFQIASENLGLTYDWEQDELVCGDVCVAWETICETVTEEVCYDVCEDYECWDECWDDCTTECWDETVCDEYGCWEETYCEDSCVEVCDTVCDTVVYECDCYLESYDICGDECVEYTEECNWVTRTYSSPAGLDEVLDTRTSIWLDDMSVEGDGIESGQHESCDPEGQCGPVNLWIQKDRFTLSASDSAASD